MTSRTLRAGIPALLLIVFLGGCAPSPGAAPSSEPGASTGFPVQLENCGTELEIAAPPERVLAIKSTSTEMLLALGLEDRIVATAFPDGPVPEQWRERADGLVVISERLPGQESVLELAPDFIYAGWESNVTAEGVGERDSLAQLGIGTYVAPAACTGPERPDRLTFEDVFDSIEEVAQIFDVSDRAAQLIADQRARLEAVAPSELGLRALWYSSGSDTPFVGGGTGAPQMIMDAVGLENIAADIPEPWGSLSWEAAVAADPDVIVLVDSAWGSAEKKKSVLASHPAASSMRAVAEGRYLVVPFPAGEAGVRNVDAVETLRAQIDDLP
ncbi:putative F420-0 ABC transporter substrate-binding protein [Microbacterium sp.]|uniref:putative F420-0 ABC transporter substrate-binding protein n=1 Tax=Microbacterium sp. TaxID=51671 RepID=UPI0028128A20|nr:putative F420-0 ABC transporter substrate-binding protein [Microbacterium sp.]